MDILKIQTKLVKQVPRCWNKGMGILLIKSFRTSEADACLFIKENEERKVLLALYMYR